MYVIKHLYIIKHLRWSVFAKIVNCLNLLTIFEKKLHLGWLVYVYQSQFCSRSNVVEVIFQIFYDDIYSFVRGNKFNF